MDDDERGFGIEKGPRELRCKRGVLGWCSAWEDTGSADAFCGISDIPRKASESCRKAPDTKTLIFPVHSERMSQARALRRLPDVPKVSCMAVHTIPLTYAFSGAFWTL